MNGRGRIGGMWLPNDVLAHGVDFSPLPEQEKHAESDMVKLVKDEFRFDPTAPIMYQDDDTHECVSGVGMTSAQAEKVFAKKRRK